MTSSSMVRIGLRPSPNLAISRPPMMNPVEVTPSTMPQISTGKSSSPYGSMSAM